MRIIITSPSVNTPVFVKILKSKKAREMGIFNVTTVKGKKLENLRKKYEEGSKMIEGKDAVVSFNLKTEDGGDNISSAQDVELSNLIANVTYERVICWVPKTGSAWEHI